MLGAVPHRSACSPCGSYGAVGHPHASCCCPVRLQYPPLPGEDICVLGALPTPLGWLRPVLQCTFWAQWDTGVAWAGPGPWRGARLVVMGYAGHGLCWTCAGGPAARSLLGMRSSGGAPAVEVVALEPDSLGFHFLFANGVHHCIPLKSCGGFGRTQSHAWLGGAVSVSWGGRNEVPQMGLRTADFIGSVLAAEV